MFNLTAEQRQVVRMKLYDCPLVKVVLLVILWCTVVFLSLITLYKVIPPEAQYSFAEHFEIYGDELIMDFVLYLFLGIAALMASVLTLAFSLLIRKR